MSNYQVGDRVRVTNRHPNGDKAVYEVTVSGTEIGGDYIKAEYYSLYTGNPHTTVELLERPAPPEPTGVGAVVQFENPLEVLRTLAVRSASGLWLTDSRTPWAWGVIAENDPVVLSEGVHLDEA